MKRRTVLQALCLLGVTNMIKTPKASGSLFTSTYAAADVALQTDSTASFWQRAQPLYAEVDNYGVLVPHHRTEIRSRWTERYLYVLFVCPFETLNLKPDPDVSRETNQLWNWDVAEMFIGSDFKNIRRYREFEISPQAEWIDLDVDLDLPDHTVGWTWNSGLQVAARIDRGAKTWYGAMRIPFVAIAEKPARAGQTFRVNFFRSQGPPDAARSIAWIAPLTETFHTPERFGILELVGKP